MFEATEKRESERHNYYMKGADNVSVCVVFCRSLTHMLMSEALRQKESCDGELLALLQFQSEYPSSWPSVSHTSLTIWPSSELCMQTDFSHRL